MEGFSDYNNNWLDKENHYINYTQYQKLQLISKMKNETSPGYVVESDNQEFMDEMIERYNHTHAFITSAYYYYNSKSLGENALAMVVVMNQWTTENIEKHTIKIESTGYDGEVLQSNATIKKESTETSCAYVMTLVQATTVHDPEKIEIVSSGTRVAIPFRKPRTWSHSPVIMCIAPQFAVEKWQLFLMNLHVIRRYGGHMHLYITSMVTQLFDVLQLYEKWGSVTLDYWVRMKFNETFTPYKEPNRNVEWRNQAGAQTDCLLQYKEVADFIAFFDIDDILIPRYSHNYHQEFSSHFSAFPNYHTIFYWKRDVIVNKIESATDLTFAKIFSTMKVTKQNDYGKSIINPLKVNSTWIHHSMQLPKNLIYRVPNTELIHIKKIVEPNPKDKSTGIPKMFGTKYDPIITEIEQKSLDFDLEQTYADSKLRDAVSLLVDHDYYSQVVFQCYNSSFYHPYFVERKPLESLCPNADDCILPQRDDISCIHSDAKYISGPEMFPITFHYAVNPFWSDEIGCYQ
ncbi:unnamed protein product [Caenorhabditis angaria]|uniref:Glycosyltransferase family 92 protein n=1 Tax=Caenorhabditis angaria TaxID=860376 RepID=A0A9P1IVW3_9PELO|nr:unnamed protein product [Caenorhabditis angaria]